MTDEIVRLKVGITGATEAQVARLERLDAVVESLKKKPDISISIQGLPKNMGNAEESAKAAAKYINAQANMIKAQNQLAVEQERTRQAIAGQAAQEIKAQAAADGLVQTQQQYNRLWTVLEHQIMNAVIQNVRKATNELKAMNAEMVSIQKVTGATDAEMQRLKDSAFEVAGNLGSTPSDYLASVTKWAQAGYKGLSDQLGELSAKTQVVGDVNEETANKFLLAVDAAYKYKGNVGQLTQVLDGANEISNNYATSVDKLANGMGIVSSLAEQAGMKVEQTMAAIGTITAKTQESGNSAARALRALILNIQGSTEIEIDTETGERWAEDEIQRTAAALGKLSVATREYKDGVMALRNPMEVIGELAEKYQKGLVTEARLQEVVASLGGKVRSNQLMALIQGYETYTSMIETYKDAVGSADNELEIYLNGWEAKSNKLVAQWTQFVESFKASDISIGLLDVGNKLLEVANDGSLGTIAAQIGTITAAMALLNSTTKKLGVNASLSQMISGLAGVTTGSVSAGKALKSFGAALNSALGPVGWFVIGTTTVISILKLLEAEYEKVNPSAKTMWETVRQSAEEYKTLTEEAEGLRRQLKEIGERIDELNGKENRTLTEQAELERLKLTNSQLQTQLELKERLAKLAQDRTVKEASGAFEKGFADENGTAEKFFGRDFLGQGWEKQIGQAKAALEMYQGILKNAQDSGNKTAEKSAQKAVDSIQKVLDEMGVSLAGQFNLIDGLDTEKAIALMRQINEVSIALQAISDPAQAAAAAMERFQNSADPSTLRRFNAELERMRGDGKVTADEVTRLAELFPDIKTIMDLTGLTAEQLAEHFNAVEEKSREAAEGIAETGNAAEDSKKAMEELTKDLKSAVSGMEAVKDAQKELKENGQLSTNTLIALLGNYGDSIDDVILKALAGLATQEEISRALEEAYQADLDKYRKTILEKNMENEDFYASWLSENAGTVKKLAEEYGIDARQYQTFAQLKAAIETGAQTAQTNAAIQGKNDRVKIFSDIQAAFENTQDAMVLKAQESTGAISRMYSLLSGLMGGIAKGLAGPMSALTGPAIDKINEVKQAQADKALKEIMNSISPPALKSPSKTSSKSSGSAKSWYETQIENLKKLEEQTKRTNQVLERSDEDTSKQRIQNLQGLQGKILSAQKEFIARGLAETSDEVNQLKLMYAGLGDDITSIYSSMADGLLEQHKDLIWQFDLKANNQRTMEEIAADDAAMVEEYRKMQDQVHQLAEYYRSQGVRENSKLIRDLQDKWWEYEKAIRSMYENLTDAFQDYIDESSHKIEELGRATGNVGKQIEIYAQRIQKAQETISALQAHNINGERNGDIHDLESQIWSDKDAIRDLQEGLWDELERAFDDIFDKAKDDIDAIGEEIEGIQDQMDEINDVLAQYDKELEGILKPINATLEKLNEQMEAEKERLEALKQPLEDWKTSLEDQKTALEEQITGYYKLNPDGSMGAYIPGLDDELDRIQGQIDQVDQQLEDANDELNRVKDAWDEQKKRDEEALTLQKKQLAVEEAQKAVQDALLALQTARSERNIYTLKDGVWAWRADEEAVAKAEKALAEAEKAKEEAEKELQDYKEEQAHKLILKRLEEQIKTLEEQKKSLEEQKKLVDRQKELLNKQIDAINKQISAINKQIEAYERESSARQKLIQDLIDRSEQEKKAWEDHYAALKDQYSQQLELLEAEKKSAEERKKAAEKQYDDWMDTWEDIRKGIETPARDISEILNDIARYGTPAMAGQVDRVTELLRQLGYAIDDVVSGGGYDPDGGGDWGGSSSGGNEGGSSGGDVDPFRRQVIDQMLANARQWASTSDETVRKNLERQNQELGMQIGANYSPASGTWDIFDYDANGNPSVKPGAYSASWGGYGVQAASAYSAPDTDAYIRQYGVRALTLEELQNDGWGERKAANGYLTSDDYALARDYTARMSPASQNTTYKDDHSITINGMKVGSDMLQRPLSDVFTLFPLYMGT